MDSSRPRPLSKAADFATTQDRSKKYRKEHRKRKSVKERFHDRRSKLQNELRSLQAETDAWKQKAAKLQEKCTRLKCHSRCGNSAVSCTKATVLHCYPLTGSETIPTQCRQIFWSEIDKYTCKRLQIGKGVFGVCYYAEIGCLKVCLKVYHTEAKYKSLFYSEVKILSMLCHNNLPWLHAVCNSQHNAILMSFHPYREGCNSSLTVHRGLSDDKISPQQWKQIILGVTSALVYLRAKNILHNDIKSDNILIEMLPADYTIARSILIDFNKACFAEDGVMYKLSHEAQRKYADKHPQVAPEVRRGTKKQTFASDIYSFGRVLHKVSLSTLKIPCLIKFAELCMNLDISQRPIASELHTSLSNLFE